MMQKVFSLLIITAFCIPIILTGQGNRSNSNTQTEAYRNKPRIAVLPFLTASTSVQQTGLNKAATAMVVTALWNYPNCVVIERSQIQAIVNEQDLADAGLTQNISDKLMSTLAVDVVLLGEMTYVGAVLHIDARLVDIRTSEVVVAKALEVTQITTIRKSLARLINQMLHEYLRPLMGSFTISSDPAGAEVYIDGNYVGTTVRQAPIELNNLIEGKYQVKLIAGGYEDWNGEIVVLPKMSQPFTIPLIAKPGSMTVSSEPTEAEVFLDNKLVGKTPLTLKEVAEGEHDLKIIKPTYKEYSRKVIVRSFQPTDIKVSLEVLPAMLVVTSDPPGALVHFKGRNRGSTPLTLNNLTPGELVLRLTKSNYDEWVTSFLLAPDERREIDAILERQVGRLSISSNPANAAVAIRNLDTGVSTNIGVTPIFNYETTVGIYNIEFQRDDFFTDSVTAVVSESALAETTLDLVEKPGRIHIDSVPRNAKVLLNGEFVGRTPMITEQSRGNYTIQLSVPYASILEDVKVTPDEDTVVKHEFKKSKSYVRSAIGAILMTTLFYLGAGE